MKVTLLNPPSADGKKYIREGRCTQSSDFWATLWPPITLAYLAAVLEAGGHEAMIIDSPAEGLSVSGTIDNIVLFGPDLIVSSSSTPTISNDLDLISQAKKRLPGVYTSVFGVHSSVMPEECLRDCGHLDFVICGEPEGVISKLCAAILGDRGYDDIPGLAYRAAGKNSVSVVPGKFIEDLDSLPFPAWHLVNRHNYKLPLKGRDFLIILPSRGCPYSCTFCTTQRYYGRKMRLRSVMNVVDEIEYDIKKFGITHFLFWSETFTFDKRYVASLCEEIMRRRLDISWTCNSRVDVVDSEVLKMMARAGCWMVSFGIESASQRILDGVKKGTRVDQASRAVDMARRAGLSVVGHFIFGLPGEDERSIDETIGFSMALGLDFAQYYCACPFPGSELYSLACGEGWIKDGDFSRFSQDLPVMDLPSISRSSISEGRARAYRRFYANPASFIRTLRHIDITNLSDISRLLRQALGFFRPQRKR